MTFVFQARIGQDKTEDEKSERITIGSFLEPRLSAEKRMLKTNIKKK